MRIVIVPRLEYIHKLSFAFCTTLLVLVTVQVIYTYTNFIMQNVMLNYTVL